MDQTERWKSPSGWTLLLLCLSVTYGGIVNAGQNERLAWDPGNYVLVYEESTGWKGVDGNETTNRIFTTPGATQEDWTLTLNVTQIPIAVTFMSDIRWNSKSLMQSEIDALVKRGCDDPWTVIAEDQLGHVYERTQVDCSGYLHQHELGRIVVGTWYAWWLRYRIRNRTLTERERSNLIDGLLKAQIVN